MSFNEKLLDRCRKMESLVCMGLDYDPDLKPDDVSAHDFLYGIVDSTHYLVCAYKINLAFYEALGLVGWRLLDSLLMHIRDVNPGCIVIADGKRGDVPRASKAYAQGLFEAWEFDAATVNPWGGMDTLEPFADYQDKGVFVWCYGSNDGAVNFQLSEYLKVIMLMRHRGRDNFGMVMGATHLSEIGRARAEGGGMPMLIPGAGIQGGDWEKALQWGSDEQGEGAIINVGRSVLYSSSGRDFAQSAQAHLKPYISKANEIAKAKRLAHTR